MNPLKFLVTILLVTQLLTGSTAGPVFSGYLPRTTTIYHKLGETVVQIHVSQYGDTDDLVFINLHDDEYTSVIAARKLLERSGGLLITIDNRKQRNIRFRLRNQTYTFDPNRIFSREGVRSTLSELGRISAPAVDEVERFGKRIVQLIPAEPRFVIALHNNTDGHFSVHSYRSGSNRSRDAKAVSYNAKQDPDDLFLTTDEKLYTQLAALDYNVILQDNEHAKKDGSLSVYCGERGIRYLNCETEHGRTGQYFEMILAALDAIEKLNTPVLAYRYSLEGSELLSDDAEVYFGEKKLGRVSSGRLEITKSFPLYDNMDLYLQSKNRRVEITIDPTRPKKKLDPRSDEIKIGVR